ncbi:MAG: Hsp20/alpha crystallin family protein [Deltaproteobacteria bacterium]|nr:Hsp20/alpha crystallin family protein [Deltaproteobacteria bacterium]
MTIWRWGAPDIFGSSFSDLVRLQNEMNRLWELASGVKSVSDRSRVYPPMNITEDDNFLYVRAELPGVEVGAIDLSLHGDQLILRGERKTAQTGEKINCHRKEREEGVFRRVINLSTRVDGNQVEAVSKNGVLTIKLAKAEEVKPRQVTIQTE